MVIRRASRENTAVTRAIQNTPSLNKLIFLPAAVRIADVEYIHSNATKLTHLEFGEIDIFVNDVAETQSIYQPVEKMQVRSLGEIRWTDRMVEEILDGVAIENWVLYIGLKYPGLRHLDLCSSEDDKVGSNEMARRYLINALQNIKHLKSYSINIFTNTKPVIDVMDDSAIQLQRFGFLVDGEDKIEEAFVFVKSAQSVSTISSLAVTTDTLVEPISISQSLIDLCHSLKYLTRLDIISGYRSSTPILLIEILQNLTMLKSLGFGQLTMDDETMDIEFFNNRLTNINIGRLESLSISYLHLYAKEFFIRSDILFAFILRSCPNLEILDVSVTRTRQNDNIYLGFRGNVLLRHIRLNMRGCRYYTFAHEFGKYWRNVKDQIEQLEIILQKDVVSCFIL